MAKPTNKKKYNKTIPGNIKPSKTDLTMFVKEHLEIDPFWDDLINYKEWKKKSK